MAIFLGPMLYVSVFHRGQGGKTAGLPVWVIFINLVVCSRSGSLAAPELLCRCGHLLGVNTVCIRVSSWARGRTAERVVVCSRSVAAPHSEHRLPAPSRRKDVVNQCLKFVAAPGLFCKRGHLLGANAVRVRVSSWARGQNCRTSGCLQQVLCQWPPRAFPTSVVSFLGPVLYVFVTEIVEWHPWASFWQRDRSVERLAWGIWMNWVVCSRH